MAALKAHPIFEPGQEVAAPEKTPRFLTLKFDTGIGDRERLHLRKSTTFVRDNDGGQPPWFNLTLAWIRMHSLRKEVSILGR